MEFSLWIIVYIFIAAFFCEYIDSMLGMGYGTILTPILLFGGFAPLKVVPVVLLSELITGFLAGFYHHQAGNVNFKFGIKNIFKDAKKLKNWNCIGNLRKNITLDSKVVLILAMCSILGTISAVFITVNLSRWWLQLYIGCIVLFMGIIILVTLNKRYSFSWRKITTLGLIASFNKGMSGGGYGPLVTGGQILAGVKEKSVVGITSLAEGLTCLVGVVSYMLILKNSIDLRLAYCVIAGAVFSVPFSVLKVKKMNPEKMKTTIAIFTVILGIFIIVGTLKRT